MTKEMTVGRGEFIDRWMRSNLEGLAFAEVAVPGRYSIHTYPDTLFPRECFARACYYVETHRIKGIYYVFGQAVCGGLQQHGWVMGTIEL